MQKKKTNILSYIFWTALAIALLWFQFRDTNWDEFYDAIARCKWGWVLLGLSAALLVPFIRALRWRMLLLPMDKEMSVRTCFNAYNICMIVNLALPRVGEIVRCGYVAKNSSVDENGAKRVTIDKALGTMVVDRVWDILSLLIVTALVLITMWKKSNDAFDFSSLGKSKVIWIVLGVIVLIALFIYLAWKLKDRNRFWSKVWGFIRGMLDGISSSLHMRHGWLFIVYTLVIWTLYWVMCVCAIKAFSGNPEFAPLLVSDALFIMFAGSASAVVPVPGGVGVYHAGVAGVLERIWGIAHDSSNAFAVLTHGSQTIATALEGIWSYVDESFFHRKKS